MKYLLDTCFVSDIIKAQPNDGVMSWLSHQAEEALYLSVVTLGEVQADVSKLSDSPRKIQLASWLSNELIQRFSGRILPIDADVALVWGIKRGEAAAHGVVLPFADSQLAATAIARGLTVVTRNTSDLERCGALTLDPWS